MNISTSYADRSEHVVTAQSNEYLELKKYIIWVLITLVPVVAVSVTIGISSGSLAIFSVALNFGIGLVYHALNLFSITLILRQNNFNFPYGTGKLENFSGFLCAIIIIPLSLIIIYSALNRYLYPPTTINLELAQVVVILSVFRSGVFVAWVLRLRRRFADYSPMMHTYFIDFKLNLIRDLSIIVGLLVGLWLQSSGQPEWAIAVDLAMGVSVAIYMFYSAVGMLVKNFRSLIDLPLPETDQLKILNALAMDFDAYEGVGNIYSQLSGSSRFIQIEMYFNNETTVEEIEPLRQRIEQRLKGHFSKLVFHLIPLVQKPSSM